MNRLDADILTAEFIRKGNAAASARRQGNCTHGWLQGPPGRAVVTCNDCGAQFPGMSLDEVVKMSREMLRDYE